MNIVFIGTSEFGLPALERLLASPHRVMAVVTQPDRPAGRGQEIRSSPIKDFSVSKNLHLYQPEDCNEYSFLREMRALSPDVLVVVAYGQKLGNDLLGIPRFYSLNIHPSLLPRFRGPAPVARAILNGETHTGVSIIKVVEKMDAGPILGIARVPVPPEATTPEMEDSLAKLGAELLLDVIDSIQRRAPFEVLQNESEASYAKKFEKGDGRIDWRRPVQKVSDAVRALQPFPGAFAFLNQTRLGIRRVRAERTPQKPTEAPGTILSVDAESFSVACSDGRVAVLELQAEGRKAMPAGEFLKGNAIKPGDRLS